MKSFPLVSCLIVIILGLKYTKNNSEFIIALDTWLKEDSSMKVKQSENTEGNLKLTAL